VGLAALALGGCGFHPLYGELGSQRAVSADMQSISITPMSSLIGVELRNHLLDRLTPSGEPASPRYRLDVKLSSRRQEVAVRLDASATRYNYHLTANYNLIDTATGETVYTGSDVSTVAYDVVDSQFATVYARSDAESRATEDLSEQIRLRLALFFDSQSTKTAELVP
jgi:LPS-assembly lipoprotein